MEKALDSLNDVSSTLLITLYARARETNSPHPIIRDDRAVEIIELLKKDFAGSANPIHRKILADRYNPKLAVSMALRSRKFDGYVLDFLRQHPGGTVINFGCGLDTRFERIDDGKVQWFDIDFPDVIALRRRFIKESERRRFIAGSILELAWIDAVKTGGPYLFLAEGVFMYLKEQEVQWLLSTIKRSFGRADLVCEVTNRFWVERMKTRYMQFKFRHQLGMTGGATFTFGIPHSRYFEEWDKAYAFIDEWTYFDDREKKLGWFNLFSAIELLRKVQWTVHYRIGA